MKFIFQGNGFPFFLLILFSFCAKNIVICRWGDEVERTSPFQIYYIHLRVGVAPMRRARREVQTPVPCTYYVSAEYRLAVEFGLAIHFRPRPLLQISRAGTHKVSIELRSFSGA